MGDNGYVMKRDGNLVQASFAAHRRPPVAAEHGNHVLQFGLIDPAHRREQIRDRKIMIEILPGKVWEEVNGLFRRQCCRQINHAALGLTIEQVQQSVQRIFAPMGIAPQQLMVTPVSRQVAEIAMPATLFHEKRPLMCAALSAARQAASGRGAT
jgi:hypothetical protein